MGLYCLGYSRSSGCGAQVHLTSGGITGTSTATQLPESTADLGLGANEAGSAAYKLCLIWRQYKRQVRLRPGCRREGATVVRVYHTPLLHSEPCTAGESTRWPVVTTTTSPFQPNHDARLRPPHHLEGRLPDLPPHLPHVLFHRLTASDRHTRFAWHHKSDHQRLSRASRHLSRSARHHQEHHAQVPSLFRFLRRPPSPTLYQRRQWKSLQIPLPNTRRSHHRHRESRVVLLQADRLSILDWHQVSAIHRSKHAEYRCLDKRYLRTLCRSRLQEPLLARRQPNQVRRLG